MSPSWVGTVHVDESPYAKPPEVPPMIAVTLNDPLSKLLELMRKHHLSQLPVVKECHMLGTVYDDTLKKILLTQRGI